MSVHRECVLEATRQPRCKTLDTAKRCCNLRGQTVWESIVMLSFHRSSNVPTDACTLVWDEEDRHCMSLHELAWPCDIANWRRSKGPDWHHRCGNQQTEGEIPFGLSYLAASRAKGLTPMSFVSSCNVCSVHGSHRERVSDRSWGFWDLWTCAHVLLCWNILLWLLNLYAILE